MTAPVPADVTAAAPALTAAELVQRAQSLPPELAELAFQADAERRLPAQSLSALTDAGLLRVLTPQRFGGAQTDIVTHAAVVEAIARLDSSLAWIASLSNAFSWTVAHFPEAAQEEVWGNGPDVRICSAFTRATTSDMRPVAGGAIVSGRWGWTSGSLHAQWAICSVPIRDRAGEKLDDGMALFPMADAVVEDTWQVAGMRGTGSNTVVVDELFIPEDRLMTLTRLLDGGARVYPDLTLYRVPFQPMMRFALAAPLVGMARAALDFAIAKAPRRGISHSEYTRQDDSPAFQVAIGEAAGLVNTVALHTDRVAQDLDRAGRNNGAITVDDRARMRSDLARISKEARNAVDLLATAHGSSGSALASAMQRIWRDVGTASRHAQLASTVAEELYGKALLGVAQPPELV